MFTPPLFHDDQNPSEDTRMLFDGLVFGPRVFLNALFDCHWRPCVVSCNGTNLFELGGFPMKNVACHFGTKSLLLLFVVFSCSAFANRTADVDNDDIAISIELPDRNPETGEIVIRIQKGKPKPPKPGPIESTEDDTGNEDEDQDGPFLLADLADGVVVRVMGTTDEAQVSEGHLDMLAEDGIVDSRGRERGLYMVDEMGFPVRILPDGSFVDADAEALEVDRDDTARTIVLEVAGQKIQLRF